MNVAFEAMTPGQAREVVSWRYEGRYDIYGFRNDDKERGVNYLTSPEHRFFAVVSDGKLIGFRSFGPDGKVPGGVYDDAYLDTGGGLRPELTGKGLGEAIVRQGISFGAEIFGARRFRVTIAAFNQRARKVCQRIGFVEQQRFLRPNDRMPFVIFTLDLDGTWFRRLQTKSVADEEIPGD